MTAPAQPRFSGSVLSSSRSVLLLVDWINPFNDPDSAALAGPAHAAARRVATLRKRLARNHVQTVYANDNYGVWRSDFRRLMSSSRKNGGASRAITELLRPERNDIAILKPRHSAFYETPLQLLLQQLKTRELIITGMATELCVLFTAMDAYLRGYRLRVPEDCVASARPKEHVAALTYLREVLGANIAPTE